MKILAFSDFRTQSHDMLLKVINLHHPDFILYAGDDLDRLLGLQDEVDAISEKPIHISLPAEYQSPLTYNETIPCYFVNGNDDTLYFWSNQVHPSFGKFYLEKNGEKVSVFGAECTYGIQTHLKSRIDELADIYLSHLPPLGVLDLSARFGINHIGSFELLESIKQFKPKVVICGHSHMWGGVLSKVGETIIANVSSHDTFGEPLNYAIINTEDWIVTLKQAHSSGIHRIRGLSSLVWKLKNLGNEEALQLASDIKVYTYKEGSVCEFESLLNRVSDFGIDISKVKARIDCLQPQSTPQIQRKITINPEEHTFIDVETGLASGLESGRVWLIGVYHKGELRQFICPRQKKSFIKFLNERNITSLVSWTSTLIH
jgi:Icc-related predicted phosphoesterase